jgi:SAM-dependent methyltransferase
VNPHGEGPPPGADSYGALNEYYNELLDSHGFSAKAVSWRDEAFQQFRFASIAQAFDQERGPFTVYEVGCGLGHLRDFLREHFPNASYSGADINPKMVERALQRDSSLAVEHRDIVNDPPPQADYVVASGIFNLRMQHTDEAWETIVRSVLKAMYATAKRGIAANFLSSHVDWKREIAYHQDPARTLQFALTELSRFAEVRHAYYPWEFTLAVYREARPLPFAPAGD